MTKQSMLTGIKMEVTDGQIISENEEHQVWNKGDDAGQTLV
jgi:hypothetical protein